MAVSRAVHRTIAVLDVAGFGDRRRTNRDQVAVRDGLYRIAGEAFKRAGIPWDATACEDRGDGMLVLIPPQVPKSLFVELLPPALVTALEAHNQGRPDPERIRLRMALHAGEVNYDAHGVTGASLNLAFRLIDAGPLKAALARSPGALAVIVSSWFFDEVVRHVAADETMRYRRVPVAVKETNDTGWICLPDHPCGVEELLESPYKGLRAFGREDRDLFFGRAAIVRELASAVATRALVPVVGASGVGKSSVVHAGLLPCLEQQETGWAIASIRPRPTLFAALAAGLARLSGATRSGTPVPVPVAELEGWQERLSRLGLSGSAELACAACGAERVLVVVDQFEEVVSQDCDPLLRQLAELPEDGMLTVVLTLREDSFGAFFVRDASFGERLRSSAVALRGMNRAELADAVCKPAERCGVRIPARLADKLVAAVHGQPGALPLLEFALDQMWRTLRPGQQLLSFDAYEEIDRLDGLLAAHADSIMSSLSDAERAVVRSVFVNHLTSPDRPDSRQVVRRSDCAPGDWRIIVRLADERLLTISRDDEGQECAEVVHEALLRAWGQLRGWLDAEGPFRSWRQLLRWAMTSWTEAGSSGEAPLSDALLSGALLVTSERWLAERAADLRPDERRFIAASVTRREEDQRRYQMLRLRAAARLARKLSRDAETAEDPVLALLLAIEALERSPDAQADRLIRACLSRLGAAETEPADGTDLARFRRRMTLADWSHGPGPAGRWVLGDSVGLAVDRPGLAVDQQGRARYGEGPVIPMPGPVVAAAYTPPGAAFLATEPGKLALWQLGGHAEKISSRDLGIGVTCLAMSEVSGVDGIDGATRTLAAACDDGVIRVFRADDLSDLELITVPGFIRDIDVSAERLVAALSHDRRIRAWDLVTQAAVCESVAGTGASRLAIDPRGDEVLVLTDAGPGRFPLSATALAAWARRAAGRELTVAERRHYLDDPAI